MDYSFLVQQAIQARENAYAPYSQFRVGAALLAKGGKIYQGCNVENAAYGETVCAERVALYKAVSEGERQFSAIAIVGGKDELVFCPPCGACRQVLSQFCSPEFCIITFDGKSTDEHTLGSLLPYTFTKAE